MPRAAISLDPRLEKIAELCGRCVSFADIGTDHGRLGAYMLQTGLCENVQFTDISEPSLMKAKRLLTTLGIADKARFLVGDGAKALEDKPDVAVIAGMGGETISGIIARGREDLADARLVLQPNVAADDVRRQLCESGYRIVDEAVVRDGRRLYVIIAAEPGELELTEMQLAVGPVLMEKKPGRLFEYAAFRLRVARKALTGLESGGHDGADLKKEIELWEEVAGWQTQE
jgi:tRNA (adenine22-N1)-methyltransferase